MIISCLDYERNKMTEIGCLAEESNKKAAEYQQWIFNKNIDFVFLWQTTCFADENKKAEMSCLAEESNEKAAEPRQIRSRKSFEFFVFMTDQLLG